jgi:Protein of unknown function (DUF3435)
MSSGTREARFSTATVSPQGQGWHWAPEALTQRKPGSVSDSQRNLIMLHSDTRTFLKHYLSRRIETDVRSIYRGLEPQTEIMRAATRMSRWIDTRRPRELTMEQKACVERDPEVQELIRRRDFLKRLLVGPMEQYKGTPEYHKLQKSKQDVINAKKRRAYTIRKEARQDFDDEQAVIDIERQLSGGAVDEDAKEMLATEECMLPEQIRLLDKLMTWPTSLSLEAEWRRRSEAINAVTAYCRVEEGGSRRGRKPKRLDQRVGRPASEHVNEEARSTSLLKATLEHLRQSTRPVACFLCYGNQNLPIDRRTKRYNRPQDLTRHFRDDHLERLEDGERIRCGFCDVKLEHKIHLRNHARIAHRTHS